MLQVGWALKVTGMSQDEGGWAGQRREKSWLALPPAPENVKDADVFHTVLR